MRKGLSVAVCGVAFAVATVLAGCGGGGSANDQGVAFTLNGFGANGSEPGDTFVTGLTAPFGAGIGFYAADFQNNLLGQGIRVQRVRLSYNIPNSSVAIPSTSLALTSVLGPAECADSTLPDNFKQENTARAGFLLVPSAINEFLILNRDSLPSLPFVMEVTAELVGITTAGDTLTSNPATIAIEYQSDLLPAPIEE